MRYSCPVCGMNHSRPCDAGAACGILQGIPMQKNRPPTLIELLRRLASATARLWPAIPRNPGA